MTGTEKAADHRFPWVARGLERYPSAMRRARISAAVLLAILVAACGTGERPSPRSGFEIYAANCASCHGDVATGDGAIDGTPIHGPAGHTWHHPDGQLVDIILGRNPSHGRTVPVFADTLTDQEVETVLAYLKTGWAPASWRSRKASAAARSSTSK